MSDQVGLTKKSGWQIGVRRTLPIQYEAAWRLLTSSQGLKLWLGAEEIEWTEGAAYKLADGAEGTVRVFSPNSHLRLTWRPPDWPKASTIQVRVIPKGDKTTIAFHQEHLPGEKERAERRDHYLSVFDELRAL